MKQYVYTMKDPLGIHARPAGLIAKLAKEYADTNILISYNGKEVKATSMMKLMSLGVKQGAQITITAEGANEDAAIIAMSEFFNNNL